MGRTYHFVCPHCQYQARISGGLDSGINCTVQTIKCLDCRELFDAFTRIRRRVETAQVVRRQTGFLPERIIPPTLLREESFCEFTFPLPAVRKPARQFNWEKVKPTCPKFAKHKVESWNDPGRCPRCGCYMERNGFPYRRWD